ncbi:Uncharacterised protein [Mycobacteroides abscessus subsp. massiliense]|nr:Uncharacterised protein [Mycobacteroides abscessus subsp. massiliense]
MTIPDLTETEAEVLQMLKDLGAPSDQWLRPMDVGRPSSYVQHGLAGLVRKGLAERKNRPTSSAWLYRLRPSNTSASATVDRENNGHE